MCLCKKRIFYRFSRHKEWPTLKIPQPQPSNDFWVITNQTFFREQILIFRIFQPCLEYYNKILCLFQVFQKSVNPNITEFVTVGQRVSIYKQKASMCAGSRPGAPCMHAETVSMPHQRFLQVCACMHEHCEGPTPGDTLLAYCHFQT